MKCRVEKPIDEFHQKIPSMSIENIFSKFVNKKANFLHFRFERIEIPPKLFMGEGQCIGVLGRSR